jgi:transcriptional regulator with XRE-family HTH domain
MAEAATHPDDVWPKATAQQLFELTKLLGLEQRVLAKQLGVSPTAVSLWATHQRPIPAKYRPGLLEWAQVALRAALERHRKEVAALPTDDLKGTAMEAFHAPLRHWQLEVLYQAGVLEQAFKKNLRWLRDYQEQGTFTASDLRSIQSLCSTLQDQAQLLLDLRDPTPQG